MNRLLILKGLPASGKTTLAKKLEVEGYVRVNRDDIRAEIGKPYSKQNEEIVREQRDFDITAALLDGRNVVSDDTNIEPTTLSQLHQLAYAVGAEVEVDDSFLKVSVDECIKRDAAREAPVGEQVIRRMAKRLAATLGLQERLPKYAVQDDALPKAVICDLDGTLALIWSRSPYDASRCEEDLVNKPVADLLWTQHWSGHKIIFVSGRSNQYESQTRNWLHKIGLPYTLHMRPQGDSRPDVDVKRDIYEYWIKGRYNVAFVLDDRDSVVKFWRKEAKLPCFQVNYGDF